jgi:hypothetical protein
MARLVPRTLDMTLMAESVLHVKTKRTRTLVEDATLCGQERRDQRSESNLFFDSRVPSRSAGSAEAAKKGPSLPGRDGTVDRGHATPKQA